MKFKKEYLSLVFVFLLIGIVASGVIIDTTRNQLEEMINDRDLSYKLVSVDVERVIDAYEHGVYFKVVYYNLTYSKNREIFVLPNLITQFVADDVEQFERQLYYHAKREVDEIMLQSVSLEDNTETFKGNYQINSNEGSDLNTFTPY